MSAARTIPLPHHFPAPTAPLAGTTLVQGACRLVLYAFPASWIALELDELDGDPTTAERPESGREVWARRPDADALICGPMFESDAPYAMATRSRLIYRYRDTRLGLSTPSKHPTRGSTFSVRGDDVTVLAGSAEVLDADVVVQGYPQLVVRGAVAAGLALDPSVTDRAALCHLADGRVAFAKAASGMRAFAAMLLAQTAVDVVDAVYLDGGGSAEMAVRSHGITHFLGDRRLPCYLLAVPPAELRSAAAASATL